MSKELILDNTRRALRFPARNNVGQKISIEKKLILNAPRPSDKFINLIEQKIAPEVVQQMLPYKRLH